MLSCDGLIKVYIDGSMAYGYHVKYFQNILIDFNFGKKVYNIFKPRANYLQYRVNIWISSKIHINNSLHLARNYARIFVRGHYLLQEANSFPRA